MEPLELFQNKKERVYFFILIIAILFLNLYLSYLNFKQFTKEEIFQTDATIVNIYQKNDHNILKLKTDNFICFTSSPLSKNFNKHQAINLYLITKNIDFLHYIKGFYTNSFNQIDIKSPTTNKQKISNFISSQHLDKQISSLYNALFLAIPIDSNLRDIFATYGILHLIAISGFHLGVISFVLYFLLHILYKPIHQKYFPYRNKKFDIIIFVTIILFSYLIFVDIVPSLLRAFVMFVFGLFFLRNNIKILSFETLFIAVCTIVALFPKLIFSLSLWFSVAGVFYIFLFTKYFQNLNKYFLFIFFNFWIYFAINPITHYFFGTTSLAQLCSPILTILFTIYYPLSGFLHLIGFGEFADKLLAIGFNLNLISYDMFTSNWFFLFYIFISLLSILSKKAFIVLNILLVLFGLWLFV